MNGDLGDYQGAMRYFQQTDHTPQQILSLFPFVLPQYAGADGSASLRAQHPVKITPITGDDCLSVSLLLLLLFLIH
jgi:hypothetical protein